MTNNNQFIMVPMELLKIKKVNGITFNDGLKTLYCYLKGWDGNAFPSYSKMAEVFGVTSRAMEERIKILVKMNLINKVNRVYTSNYYEVLDFPHIDPPESIHASPVEDVKPISNAIPQVVIEESAQSDTEALSDDVEECPFFTTSEEAFNNESEPSQESSDYNYMEDEEEINTISIKDKDYLIARANQFYANHAVGDSENTLSSLLISEMNIEGVHLDFVIAHFRQEKRAFTERFKQENKWHEINQGI
ncbi:hypothetical protein [Klebsiella variicola]|uniref:hypothetical protein n=1 Tax=Klebsiella variicola TaxID=244366 RepID=UPI0004A1738E|nr:hypothetical protein [Klebsiella variicola]KDH28288.1 hypothetical protein AE36_01196 [Klebsiella variicola]QKK55416.1 hypothetical protein HL854_15790 [Klebsiella variicola]HDS7205433.1 hypothetical protein [Klebsiella quasipneumoniae subsp. similipneumoniae]